MRYRIQCPACTGDRRQTYREWGGRDGMYRGPVKDRRCHACRGRGKVWATEVGQ